jgi:hypothetical protein
MREQIVAARVVGAARRRVGAGAIAIVVLMGGAVAVAHVAYAAEAPVSRGVCQGPKSRPKIIELAVDGSGALSGYSHHGQVGYSPGPTANLHWTVWTSTEGRASGYLWVDDGYPSVGGGTFYAVPVSIRVWRPVGGVFTRLRITPHGSARFHPNKYWVNPKPMIASAQSCSHGTWSW